MTWWRGVPTRSFGATSAEHAENTRRRSDSEGGTAANSRGCVPPRLSGGGAASAAGITCSLSLASPRWQLCSACCPRCCCNLFSTSWQLLASMEVASELLPLRLKVLPEAPISTVAASRAHVAPLPIPFPVHGGPAAALKARAPVLWVHVERLSRGPKRPIRGTQRASARTTWTKRGTRSVHANGLGAGSGRRNHGRKFGFKAPRSLEQIGNNFDKSLILPRTQYEEGPSGPPCCLRGSRLAVR